MISQFIKKLQQLKFVNNKPQNTEKLKKRNTRTERYIATITVEILTYFSQYLIKFLKLKKKFFQIFKKISKDTENKNNITNRPDLMCVCVYSTQEYVLFLADKKYLGKVTTYKHKKSFGKFKKT